MIYDRHSIYYDTHITTQNAKKCDLKIKTRRFPDENSAPNKTPPSVEDDVFQALIFLHCSLFDAFIVEMPLKRLIRKLLGKEDDARRIL